MPELTRRRSLDHRNQCWHVYYGDVHVGTIAARDINPHNTNPWAWQCGFYPGSNPGEYRSGTAATFDEARTDFERAWEVFLSKRTEADFQAAWRDQRDWTAQICDVGKRRELPSQKPNSLLRCPCGKIFDSHSLQENLVHVPHIIATVDEPVPLPDGRKLVTLKDAGNYITKLPKAEHTAAEWQTAMGALILVATHGGPTMFARIGIMQALNRNIPRPFAETPSKKAHWGKRKLARDR